MSRPKHIPLRTCVACRQTSDKRTLVRVVRSTEGVVSVDPTGKANGRGAYVCLDGECIALAKKKGALGRSLKAAAVGEEVWEGLSALLTTTPAIAPEAV